MLRIVNTARCPRCNSRLFVSRDPLDEPGTTYCISGHSFIPENRPANRIGTERRPLYGPGVTRAGKAVAAFLLFAAIGLGLGVGRPEGASAGEKVVASSYQSNQACDYDGPEDNCAKLSSGTYKLLKVVGTGYATNRPVMIWVVDVVTWHVVSSGATLTDGVKGVFTYNTTDVFLSHCATKRPMMVIVTDFLTLEQTSTAFLGCHMGD